MADVQRVSYSLEQEYQELFREITKVTDRSMTQELRRMLDARAATLGLRPVNEPDPKFFASVVAMVQGTEVSRSNLTRARAEASSKTKDAQA